MPQTTKNKADPIVYSIARRRCWARSDRHVAAGTALQRLAADSDAPTGTRGRLQGDDASDVPQAGSEGRVGAGLAAQALPIPGRAASAAEAGEPPAMDVLAQAAGW